MIYVSDIYYHMKIDRFAKDLATGSYDLLVLDALRKRPAYGYEIVRHISEQSKYTIRWHLGTVYHVLHHLERQGLVTSRWKTVGRSRQRKYYRLTPRGRSTWRRQRVQWQAFSKAVNSLLGP
jgi:PadR family transcriptional regulator, regulatory protein PadR